MNRLSMSKWAILFFALALLVDFLTSLAMTYSPALLPAGMTTGEARIVAAIYFVGLAIFLKIETHVS